MTEKDEFVAILKKLSTRSDALCSCRRCSYWRGYYGCDIPEGRN